MQLSLHVMRAGDSLGVRLEGSASAGQCAAHGQEVDSVLNVHNVHKVHDTGSGADKGAIGKWSVSHSARNPHTALKPATLNSARRYHDAPRRSQGLWLRAFEPSVFLVYSPECAVSPPLRSSAAFQLTSFAKRVARRSCQRCRAQQLSAYTYSTYVAPSPLLPPPKAPFAISITAAIPQRRRKSPHPLGLAPAPAPGKPA